MIESTLQFMEAESRERALTEFLRCLRELENDILADPYLTHADKVWLLPSDMIVSGAACLTELTEEMDEYVEEKVA